MLKIFKSIWKFIVTVVTFVIDTIQNFIEWLKLPGSKLKFICIVLSILFVTMGLITLAKQQEIDRLNVLIISNSKECEVQINKRDADIRGKNTAFAEIAKKMKLEQDKLDALREVSAKELDVLHEKLERIEIENSSWKERYDNRPKGCRAALEMLDSACPSMEDY